MLEKFVRAPLRAFLSEDTDGQRRLTRVKLTIFSSFMARGLTVLISLIYVPLALNYLGSERYGVWLTINSIVGLFSLADLGIGNGLLNAVSDAFGKKDVAKARQYIASAFATLTLAVLSLTLLFLAIYPFVPWAELFNVQSALAAEEVGPSLLIFVLCFLIGIPIGLVGKVQAGYQEGYLVHFWTIIGKLMTLGTLFLAIAVQGGLPLLVLALVGTPLLSSFFNTIHFFKFRQPELWPSFREANIPYGKQLLHTGLLFFTLQSVGIIAYSSDTIILARILGPDAVAQFGVTSQLFGLTAVLLNSALAPLWPAYAEATAMGDGQWVRRVFKRTLTLSIAIAIPLSALLFYFAYDLLELWIGTQIVPPPLLMLSLAIWHSMAGINNSFAMLFNGAGVIRLQIIWGVLMAVGNILLSIFLVQRIGISGVTWGSIITQTVIVLIPSAIYLPRLLKKIDSNKTVPQPIEAI